MSCMSKVRLVPMLSADWQWMALTIQEKGASLVVGCDTLQERQRVADSI